MQALCGCLGSVLGPGLVLGVASLHLLVRVDLKRLTLPVMRMPESICGRSLGQEWFPKFMWMASRWGVGITSRT